MTFQIFGTGHLGPQYRPRPIAELPKLQPGAADFLAKFAAEVGIPLCPWQVELIRSLEVAQEPPPATPAGEAPHSAGSVVKEGPVIARTEEAWAQSAAEALALGSGPPPSVLAEALGVPVPPGPVVPVSAELVRLEREDPDNIGARAHVDERLRELMREPACPFPSREFWSFWVQRGGNR